MKNLTSVEFPNLTDFIEYRVTNGTAADVIAMRLYQVWADNMKAASVRDHVGNYFGNVAGTITREEGIRRGHAIAAAHGFDLARMVADHEAAAAAPVEKIDLDAWFASLLTA